MKPVGPPPIDPPRAPLTPLPAGACDAHFHMLSGVDDFPLWEGRVEDPAPGRDYDAWIATYQRHAETLGLSHGVVVHSILYGDDNAVTIETVRRLGPGYKGIGLVRDGAAEAELNRLAEAGIVGVRLNYVHGGVLSWEGAVALAPALAERGMHIQMLAHAEQHLTDLAPDIAALPCPVVFDHIAWPDIALGPKDAGFQTLCRLLAEGHAYAKLSGLYRLSNVPYEATDAHLAALVAANPERCLWGSDWPHIMLADAKTPDSGDLVGAFQRVVTSSDDQARILVQNPAVLYQF